VTGPVYLSHSESESFGKIERGDFAMKKKRFYVEQIVAVLKHAQ